VRKKTKACTLVMLQV